MNKLRVAAYCRVSTNHEEQEFSLETQISYYGKLIAEHKDCTSMDLAFVRSRNILNRIIILIYGDIVIYR